MTRVSAGDRFDYYKRTISAYVLRRNSHLTFWHDVPEVHPRIDVTELGPYYMRFRAKADYPGPFDDSGIPLLDYGGSIGPQYNPIAIAQYGLANYNLIGSDDERRDRVINVADWLVDHLEVDPAGFGVWNHYFRWEYRQPLVPPWRSGLAQGQGISLLVRAHDLTGDHRYRDAAERAFRAIELDVERGGVLVQEPHDTWIEEYIVHPPTHILNGFIWALWGVHDWNLVSGHEAASRLFESCVGTLVRNLQRYDTGYWSRYELADTRLDMLASPFYHRLHIVQLEVMDLLTGEGAFSSFARRWAAYESRTLNRWRALAGKVAFKVLHY